MLPGAGLHRCLIRTGLAARVTHSIRVGGGATATRGIGVESVIQGGIVLAVCMATISLSDNAVSQIAAC
jgi:hypothetical protein